ncbi:hypothetical protein HZB02_02480 [Candidatus Woesearchaeota archaeon]|nr:hypothetical protein [Candidatus Woesearchaeota archaeon]
MQREDKKQDGKFISWIKRNRRILYWPLGGLVYCALLPVFILIPYVNLIFILPFLFISQLVVFIWEHMLIDFFRLGFWGIILGTFILLELLLCLIGYFSLKIKRKESNFLFILTLLKRQWRLIILLIITLSISVLAYSLKQDFSYNVVILNGKISQLGNFNEIMIQNGKVTIHQIFEKPNPCTSVKYRVYKEGQIIKVIPSLIPTINPFSGCTAIMSFDFVEVTFKLKPGNYTVQCYNYQGGIFIEKTIELK